MWNSFTGYILELLPSPRANHCCTNSSFFVSRRWSFYSFFFRGPSLLRQLFAAALVDHFGIKYSVTEYVKVCNEAWVEIRTPAALYQHLYLILAGIPIAKTKWGLGSVAPFLLCRTWKLLFVPDCDEAEAHERHHNHLLQTHTLPHPPTVRSQSQCQGQANHWTQKKTQQTRRHQNS